MVTGHVENYEIFKSINYPIILRLNHRFNPLPKIYPYDCMMTPYDKLKSLEDAFSYLKPGITFAILDKVALSQTDDQAADLLQKERAKLFKTINERDLKSG